MQDFQRVSGDGTGTPQQWDQRSFEKQKEGRIDTFGCGVTGERKGYPTPPAGSTDLPGQICNSEPAHLGLGDRFPPPPTAAAFCDGGSICHLQILEETIQRGALGATRDSELRVFAV